MILIFITVSLRDREEDGRKDRLWNNIFLFTVIKHKQGQQDLIVETLITFSFSQ